MPTLTVPVSDQSLPGADGFEGDDPTLDSDGMTVDTPSGPIDMVAIARARAKRPTRLNDAERAYLAISLDQGADPLTEAQSLREALARHAEH